MLGTRSELLAKMRLGEDSFLELKEVRFSGDKVTAPHRDALADELAAFANSRGGVLVLGADDRTRDVLGIPLSKLDAAESLVREICQSSIEPPLAPVIERMTLPDAVGEERPLLRIEVPRSLFVHRSPGGYLHRVGSSKRVMSPEYLARLFQQRSQARIIRFDEQCVPGAVLDDLAPHLWQRFATDRTRDSREDLLGKLGLARRDDDGEIRPTVAGVLMASPDPRRFLPNAYVQAVAYRDADVVPEGDGVYQIDARDIAGPLDEQIFAACDFVRKNMRLAARKMEGREDFSQYDMVAVFEALTNAVAHRDYAMYGSKIRLRMFRNRMELFSPGAIPNTMTLESLAYRQAARNEVLTSLLARCPIRSADVAPHRTHIMDKRGEGVPIILARSRQLSGREPIFLLIDDAELLLTIHGAESEAGA